MTGLESDIQSLFEDIEDCANRFATDSRAFFAQFKLLPLMIGLGNGQVLWLSQQGHDALGKISNNIRANSKILRSAVAQNEMRQLTANVVGRLLVPNPQPEETFSLPSDLKQFKRNLTAAIETEFANSRLKRTHIFGAWLLKNSQNCEINVGPVRFIERHAWLEKIKKTQIISAEDFDQIDGAWKSREPPKAEKRRAFDAKMVFDTVGPCDWTCEIDVFGHSMDRSREKALLAARITFAAIALNWEQPSRFLKQTGLYFDVGQSRTRTTMTYSGIKFVSASMSSVDIRDYFVQDYNEFKKLSDLRLKTVGNAVRTFVSVAVNSARPKLESRLCQSLVWFNEACNEQLPFLAIVKFVAAMDTLAKGGRANGIGELIKNRLSLKSLDGKFLKDGTSAKELINQIYNAGRSQIVHGTRPSIVDDLDELRAYAELLTTYALRACIHWLSKYSGPDDEDAFKKYSTAKI